MRPGRLFVTDDLVTDSDWIRRMAALVLESDLPGLPSHMRADVRSCASAVLDDDEVGWSDYVYLGLIAVQARPRGEGPEEIALRRELEAIFFEMLLD